MDNQETIQKVADAVKNATNILITINRNPSVDQVAAAIGLSFVLEKLDKFATAIFSGKIPPAVEFLNPSETFESNMEILRDFIVTVDKEKVDRLRYKVEGDVVRIYITPYKTTLSAADLNYESGDYNVDLMITIGAVKQEDLDDAITSAERVLHDATVLSINNSTDQPAFATINWADSSETSYCEMVTDLAELLGENEMEENIATALLTGIIAETDQFKNGKTTPKAMQIAAKLMGYGANQQLIAVKLEEGATRETNSPVTAPTSAGGSKSTNEIAQEIDQGVVKTTEVVHAVNNEAARSEAEQELGQVAQTGKLDVVEATTPSAPETTTPVVPASNEVLQDLANYQAPEPYKPEPTPAPAANVVNLPLPPLDNLPGVTPPPTEPAPTDTNSAPFSSGLNIESPSATSSFATPATTLSAAPAPSPVNTESIPAPVSATTFPDANSLDAMKDLASAPTPANPFMTSATTPESTPTGANVPEQTLADLEKSLSTGEASAPTETPASQFKIPGQ